MTDVNAAEYISYSIQEEPPLSLDERIKALETASRKQADEEARDKEANALLTKEYRKPWEVPRDV